MTRGHLRREDVERVTQVVVDHEREPRLPELRVRPQVPRRVGPPPFERHPLVPRASVAPRRAAADVDEAPEACRRRWRRAPRRLSFRARATHGPWEVARAGRGRGDGSGSLTPWVTGPPGEDPGARLGPRSASGVPRAGTAVPPGPVGEGSARDVPASHPLSARLQSRGPHTGPPLVLFPGALTDPRRVRSSGPATPASLFGLRAPIPPLSSSGFRGRPHKALGP